MSIERRRQIAENARLVVVKLGTAVLTDPKGTLDYRQVGRLAEQVVALRRRGVKVVVVSSGAIGAGMAELGLAERPEELPLLQASAAVGQGKLIAAYERSFAPHGYHTAQILLTRDDMDNRARYLNASNTLHALLGLRTIPIVNENDTISVEEIGFLENDALAMMVAGMARADLLVALSGIDGLYRNPEAPQPEREIIDVVEGVDCAVEALASSEKSARGRGGMEAKLRAIKATTVAGIPVVIANGWTPDVLPRLFDGERLGTLFLPSPNRVRSRKLWLGFGGRPRGRIVVDPGARQAIAERGTSLLPSGILEAEGDFKHGDLVAVATADGEEFARGLCNYASAEIHLIKGLHTREIESALGACPYHEVIHRDNMALSPSAHPFARRAQAP